MAYSNESPLGRVSLQSEVLEDVGVGRKCPEEIPVGREGRADVTWKGRHMGKPFRVTFRAEVQVARHLAQGFSLSPVPTDSPLTDLDQKPELGGQQVLCFGF